MKFFTYKNKINHYVFIVTIILLFIILFSTSSVSAVTNTIYKFDDGTVNLDIQKHHDVVIEAIGKFVYSIAGYVENIVAKIFGKVIGTNTFPWADRILFNTIPFLDVNYISPSNGSLYLDYYGNKTLIGNVIQNIYYVVFTISILFFTVSIGIMALKLAISSIADEKAKYKQAIQNWIFAIILIFTSHYLISFIFFVNEKLVEVASNLLESNIEESGVVVKISPISLSNDEVKKVAKRAISEAFENIVSVTEFTNDNIVVDYGDKDGKSRKIHATISVDSKADHVWEVWNWGDSKFSINIDELEFKDDYYVLFCSYMASLTLNTDYMENFTGIHDYQALRAKYKTEWKSGGLGYLWSAGHRVQYAFEKITGWIGGNEVEKKAMQKIMSDAAILTLMSDEVIEDYNNKYGTDIAISSMDEAKTYYFLAYENSDNEVEYSLLDIGINIKLGTARTIGMIVGHFSNDESPAIKNENGVEVINGYLNAVLDVWANNNSVGAQRDLFTNLGKFFKNLAYGPYYNAKEEIEGFTSAQFNVIPALLYVIFVVQSIMYLISYVRRLFYIVILALFSPLVIVFDFVTKVTV